MNTFLRILSYSNQVVTKLILFFVYSVFGVIFGLFNIILVIPMMSVLFDRAKAIEVPVIPDFSLSQEYFKDLFNHFFLQIIRDNGKLDALLFVCALIVSCVFLANVFRYLERVMATKI